MRSFRSTMTLCLLAAVIAGSCHKAALKQSAEHLESEEDMGPVGMRVWYAADSSFYCSYDSTSEYYDHDAVCDSIFRRALHRAAVNGGGRITMEPAVYPLSITLQLCSNLLLKGNTEMTGNVLIKAD